MIHLDRQRLISVLQLDRPVATKLAYRSVCRVYHKLYLSQAWDGGYAAEMAVLRGLWAAGAVLLAVAVLFV